MKPQHSNLKRAASDEYFLFCFFFLLHARYGYFTIILNHWNRCGYDFLSFEPRCIEVRTSALIQFYHFEFFFFCLLIFQYLICFFFLFRSFLFRVRLNVIAFMSGSTGQKINIEEWISDIFTIRPSINCVNKYVFCWFDPIGNSFVVGSFFLNFMHKAYCTLLSFITFVRFSTNHGAGNSASNSVEF